MKKFTAISLTVASILVFATGCSSDKGGVAEEMTAQSVLDNQIYGRAVRYMDESVCDGISDTVKAEECSVVVGSLNLYTKARSENNEEYCNDIELSDYKDSCKQEIKMRLAQIEAIENYEENIQEEVDQMSAAMEEGNVEACENLESDTFKETCTNNIWMGKAYEENDMVYCDEVKDAYLKKMCRDSVSD